MLPLEAKQCYRVDAPNVLLHRHRTAAPSLSVNVLTQGPPREPARTVRRGNAIRHIGRAVWRRRVAGASLFSMGQGERLPRLILLRVGGFRLAPLVLVLVAGLGGWLGWVGGTGRGRPLYTLSVVMPVGPNLGGWYLTSRPLCG